MRIRYIVLVVGLLALAFGVGRLSAAGSSAVAGSLEPPGPPESTFSYSLEDIYNRLDTGAAGTQSTFTEPATGPVAGTMHTLNEIIAIAPAIDDTNGANQANVLAGKTTWGLTSDQWGLITGTYPFAPVPKTGAGDLGGYTEVLGEDGHASMQKGVAWPVPRFITSTTGIVTDTLTGLIWLQDASCGGTKIWSDALAFANSLYDGWTGDGSGGDCGLSDGSSAGDWRLPNVRELQSLIDYGRYGPALPSGHPFTGVQSSAYWSSTSVAYDTSYAWGVGLYDGYVLPGDKMNADYVWPVRGGK
jgi:hypothetical protein